MNSPDLIPAKDLLTLEGLSKISGVSRPSIISYRDSGDLQDYVVQVGKRFFYSSEAVDRVKQIRDKNVDQRGHRAHKKDI